MTTVAAVGLDAELRAALRESLLAIADDELIIGHRHAEWTGFGPDLESDVALSSIAQEEIGHARLLYTEVARLDGAGEDAVDRLAFGRPAEEFRSAVLLERPNTGVSGGGTSDPSAWTGEWGFTIVRMFLYDHADAVRLEAWSRSPLEPMANLARTLLREERYHRLFAETWLSRLSRASEDAHSRLQDTVDRAWPEALGLFEPTEGEERLVRATLLPEGSAAQSARWQETTRTAFQPMGIRLSTVPASGGGRRGAHTNDLTILMDDVTSVWRSDPAARW